MEIQAQSLSAARTGHIYAVGEASADELWIVLHGYGQLAARFLRHFTILAGPQRRVVAPEGLSRFYLDDAYERVGASWMTRLDRHDELEDAHDWLDRVYAYECEGRSTPPCMTVLGFSQGAPTAGRWLLRRRPEGARRLICWGAGPPHDVDLRAEAEYLRSLRLDLVIGDTDEYLTAERVARERERLDIAGIAATWTHYSGGHRMNRRALAQLAEI
jgi:predicted esterase